MTTNQIVLELAQKNSVLLDLSKFSDTILKISCITLISLARLPSLSSQVTKKELKFLQDSRKKNSILTRIMHDKGKTSALSCRFFAFFLQNVEFFDHQDDGLATCYSKKISQNAGSEGSRGIFPTINSQSLLTRLECRSRRD